MTIARPGDDREVPRARVRFEKACWHLATAMLTIGRTEIAKVEAKANGGIGLQALIEAGRDAPAEGDCGRTRQCPARCPETPPPHGWAS